MNHMTKLSYNKVNSIDIDSTWTSDGTMNDDGLKKVKNKVERNK